MQGQRFDHANWEKYDPRHGKNRKPGFVFQIITGVLFLTAFGYWGYNQIMKQVLGGFNPFKTEKVSAVMYGPPSILLLNPQRTVEFLATQTAAADTGWPYLPRDDDWELADTLWYAEGMERPRDARRLDSEVWERLGSLMGRESRVTDYWEEILSHREVSYRTIREPDLERLTGDYHILILPGALLLSDEEKKGVKQFVAQGGRLLACWSVGTRDENGEWVGFDFLSHLLGARPGRQIQDPAGGPSFILSGGSPITAMIPPGTHLVI